MIVETQVHLGPAQVLDVLGNRVYLKFPDKDEWATMALPGGGYQPARGDLVLAIGSGADCYVIGVIMGQGMTTLTAPADLRIVAPKGSITLVATKGVNVTAPEIRMQTRRLEVIARSCFEKFGNAYTWVQEKLHVKAGAARTTVKEHYHLNADRIVENARRDVTIDGDSINLG